MDFPALTVQTALTLHLTNLLEKFKQNTPYLTTNVNMSGNEALAAYNAPMVKEAPKPLDSSVDEFVIKDIPSPATLKGDEIETLSGDRILNSEGKLQAIRVKGEDTSKEYYFYKGKPASIITRDNNTGLPLRKDSFFNNNQNAYVIEFDKNGSPHRKFSFLDGKISDAKLIQDNKIILNDYFFFKRPAYASQRSGYQLRRNEKILSGRKRKS